MEARQKFPRDKELKKIRRQLAGGIAARPLPADADAAERLKYAICAEFVKYKNKNKISQKAMAQKIGVDEALMSKIINYLYDEFTIDRLLNFLGELYPMARVSLQVG